MILNGLLLCPSLFLISKRLRSVARWCQPLMGSQSIMCRFYLGARLWNHRVGLLSISTYPASEITRRESDTRAMLSSCAKGVAMMAGHSLFTVSLKRGDR